jgi:hypothetical protein
MNKKKSQPVNKEAFRMLAVEIGLNEASRKLGVPIPTGKSWARRGGWKLPKRPGGRPQRTMEASSLNPIADALDATHKELEAETKTALMQTLHKASQAVATRKGPLDITNMAQFRDACLSAARMFGWDGKASVTYYGDDNRQVIVCDENKRKQLIEQRQRLLEAESERSDRGLLSQGKVIEIEPAAPVTIPVQETQSNANVGTENGIVARYQSPAQDPLSQWRDSVGRAATWRSEPENNAGSFGPHPEEIY